MSLCKNCGWWKYYEYNCIFEFSVKIYVRNTINISCAKILFPGIITHYGYAVKCHITSVALWLDCLQTSLFISIEGNSHVPPVCPTPCSTAAGMVTPKGSMSTEGETLQVSVLPYICSICPAVSVCLGCYAAEFGISGGTYELPCISVFAFITRVEFVHEAFRLHYKL
jgi:hypothetical protein